MMTEQTSGQTGSHLDGLNEAQREAVLQTDGPLLVLAGAGAGKTRVIAHRILEIVRRGTAPENILAITFTNKAAGEMRERVVKLLNESGYAVRQNQQYVQSNHNATHVPEARKFDLEAPPFVSTFHSLGLSIIKEHAKELGFKHTPNIYDRADSMREMKNALKNLSVEDIEPRAALGMTSKQKGNGVTASQFAENVAGSSNPRERIIAQAWLMYEATLHKDGALDFDDLLLRAMHLLRDNAEVRGQYQRRWSHIHIDEYQDTNKIQAKMAEMLVGEKNNICCVGDLDQCIYSWRGAEIANMMSFDKKFPGGKMVLLEQNYRSTKNILAAANEVISKNKCRQEKNLFTNNIEGEKVSIYQAFDETDEAGFIARRIKELRADEGAKPSDFAVLYRANFQSRAIEEALLTADIPYQVLGTRFFERKDIKDALSFIRAALRGGSADLARIANVPARGIGKVTLLKILAGRENELNGATRDKVLNLHAIFARIRDAATHSTPSELVRHVIVETGMERDCREDKIDGVERLDNLKELTSLASRYDELSPETALDTFLENAALQSDQDELKEDSNAVRLMTVHAAKGLEFPYVFITGLEEGLFPYEREGDTSRDNEEERRLCYVAITRAEKRLFLTYASYRTVFGSKNATIPSQFLSDISDDLITMESPERIGKTIYLE